MQSSFTLFRSSWSILTTQYKKIFLTLSAPFFLIFCIDLLVGSIQADVYVDGFEVLISQVLLFGILLLNVFASIALLGLMRDPEHATVRDALRFGVRRLLPYIFGIIAFVFLLVLGVISLLVTSEAVSYLTGRIGISLLPGLFFFLSAGAPFFVWFALTPHVLMFENLTLMAALKKSREYVRGRWWATFGRFSFLLLILLIVTIVIQWITESISPSTINPLKPLGDFSQEPSLLSIIGGHLMKFVLVPLAVVYSYFLYIDLRKLDEAFLVVTEPDSKELPIDEKEEALEHS